MGASERPTTRYAPQPEFRNDEAVADVELADGQQRRVASMPGAISEVARQPSDTVSDDALVEEGEGGHIGPHGLV